jgi:hypothetical protein
MKGGKILAVVAAFFLLLAIPLAWFLTARSAAELSGDLVSAPAEKTRSARPSSAAAGSAAPLGPNPAAGTNPSRLAPLPPVPANRVLWPESLRLGSRGSLRSFRLALDEVVLRDARSGDRVVSVSAADYSRPPGSPYSRRFIPKPVNTASTTDISSSRP